MNPIDILCEIIIGDKTITQVSIQNSIQALGVQITLSLEWKDQFSIMRKKMIKSIKKLMRT